MNMLGQEEMEYSASQFPEAGCQLVSWSNVISRFTKLRSSMIYPLPDNRSRLYQAEDDDPLTIEELMDAEISERDFECGRATDLPAEMSDEAFLAHFRSL